MSENLFQQMSMFTFLNNKLGDGHGLEIAIRRLFQKDTVAEDSWDHIHAMLNSELFNLIDLNIYKPTAERYTNISSDEIELLIMNLFTMDIWQKDDLIGIFQSCFFSVKDKEDNSRNITYAQCYIESLTDTIEKQHTIETSPSYLAKIIEAQREFASAYCLHVYN